MTFQAKLTTKLEKFSVDDTIIELRNSVDKDQLNTIVKNLLKHLDRLDEEELAKRTFDFLVGGRFLQLSVDKHLDLYSDEIDAREILNEQVVEVEYVLSLESPEPLDAIPHEDWVSCVDANQRYIVTGSYDNSIRIFSIGDRKNLITVSEAHEKPVTRVKWIKNLTNQTSDKDEYYFVSSGHDEVSIVRKFNAKSLTTEIVFVFRGHNRSVNCLDDYDDVLATGSFDKTLRIWSLNPNDDEERMDSGDVIEQNGTSDGNKTCNNKGKKKQKTKSSEKSVSKTNRNAMMTITGHQESVTGIRWFTNETNTLATCSMDRTICVWDVEVGECKRRVLSAKPLLGMDYSKEHNLIISASCDRHIRSWDSRAPDNATAVAAYTSHNTWVSSVMFGASSSYNFISGGYDNLVKLWDLRSPKSCLYDLIGHHNKVLDVNWRNPGHILSGSADSTLKVFVNKDV